MTEDNSDIKVSVWCTCYNHEKYIRKCLDGFVMQKTDFKYEAIVHDDASTDGSADIIREYAEKYPDIIKPIFQTENQYSKNVNLEKEFFIPNIKGKYVAFCEGDDFWNDKNKLQIQYNVMKNYNFSSCFHLTQIVNESGNVINNKLFPSIIENRLLTVFQGRFPSNCILFLLLHCMCFIHVSSLMLDAEKYVEYVLNIPEFAKSLLDMKIGDAPLIAYFASFESTCYLPAILSSHRDSHAGSYTYETVKKMQQDAELRKRMINAWRTMYLKYNEFTNHKYENIIINSNSVFR